MRTLTRQDRPRLGPGQCLVRNTDGLQCGHCGTVALPGEALVFTGEVIPPSAMAYTFACLRCHVPTPRAERARRLPRTL